VFERDVLPGQPVADAWYPEAFAGDDRPNLVSAVPFCDMATKRPLEAFRGRASRRTTRYHLPMPDRVGALDRERYKPSHSPPSAKAPAKARLDVATRQISRPVVRN